MSAEDWPAIRAIHEQGIATGDATFEREPPSREEWDADHLEACRIVAAEDGAVVGWAALSPVSDRCVYAGVAEASVYVSAEARGRGVGALLLRELCARSEEHGLWTLQAGIFPENRISLSLVESCGFRVVGRRERLGRMHGRWRDVLLLERRSPTVGVEGTEPPAGQSPNSQIDST